MRNEAAVWTQIRLHMPPTVWAKRIEDSSGDLGTYDVILMSEGRCGWLELKHTETARTKPTLRKGQMAFGRRLERFKTPGFYICGSRDGKVRVFNRLLDPDHWKDHLVETWDQVNDTVICGLLREMGLNVG